MYLSMQLQSMTIKLPGLSVAFATCLSLEEIRVHGICVVLSRT